MSISSGVNATEALAVCVDRLIIVNQKIRQLKMQKVHWRSASTALRGGN
jgi:hypothetical protein